MERRDLVVVGTSAGGVAALPRLVAQLPAGFPAAVLIVQHLPPNSSRHLTEIVQRTSALPVGWAAHGDVLRPGTIAIAPPGVHLRVEADRLALDAEPAEHHVRPSIDHLFRSAAASHGARTIGVLLTGLLDDGAAGIAAIARAGGVTIVQDPDDAEFPDMPSAAIVGAHVNHVVPLSEIGALLVRLTT